MAEKGFAGRGGVQRFADEVPVEINTVSRWRRGRIPGDLYLRRVGEILDCETGFLVEGAVSDPESWSANHALGGQEKSDSGEAQPSAVKLHPSQVSPDQPPEDNPDAADRPEGVPQLPEPTIPDSAAEWTQSLVVYKAALSYLDDLSLPGDVKDDILFFFNRLAVAAQQDLAAARPVRTPNGENKRA